MRKLCRLIAPQWLLTERPSYSRVLEGEFTNEEIQNLNASGYNVYYLPNTAKRYIKGTIVDGTQIDTFNYVFVDYDIKSNVYPSKDLFIEEVAKFGAEPSIIVDSGNGIHVYWRVTDLDAASYLRLQRRLVRALKTDEATCSIFQLMRLPGTLNTKIKDNYLKCETLYTSDVSYSCEELNKILPPITISDEQFCQQHYDRIFNTNRKNINIDDKMPTRFGKLLSENHEAQNIWSEISDDRSKNDYRLGHIMFANGFSKSEAMTVLANSAKALQRAPVHRLSYAENIVDKIWTFELEPEKKIKLSQSVKDILQQSEKVIKGTPFRCHKRIDNTEYGFRLGQVIGLVAGSGVGKTAFALNLFKWFAEQNPEYHHLFIPLEQPSNEIADRWRTMCRDDTSLHEKVHVMSNYDEDGNFRHLSLEEIKDYVVMWQKESGNKKIGCVVIDHIGALKKKGTKEENQDLMTICHNMKAFAVQTNTLLVMQSQSSREKAGIGDLELNKDAAYGTIFFESYCDYLITMWQPLKRCHSEQACPTVTAFKFCKIRHKKAKKDIIKEDVPYFFYFDSDIEVLRDMTQDEQTAFNFFLAKATNKRKLDRKTELVQYTAVPYKEGGALHESNFNNIANSRKH